MSANDHDDDQADTADVIERLRAENAALRGLPKQILSLSAENAELRKQRDELAISEDALRVENATIREDLVRSSEDMGRLCAENAELREEAEKATQEIVDDICGDPYGMISARLDAADAIAAQIAALKTEGTTA